MKRIDTRRFVFLLFGLILMLSIGIGFWWNPKKLKLTVPQKDDLLQTVDLDHTTSTHNIDISDEGNLVLVGDDCYFDIENITSPGRTVVLKFTEPLDEKVQFVTSTKSDTGEEDLDDNKRWAYFFGEKCSDCVCIEIPENESESYTTLRIRPSSGVNISSVEIHSEEPVVGYQSLPNFSKHLMLGVFTGLFLFVVFCAIENRLSLSLRVYKLLNENKKHFLVEAAIVLISVLIAVLLNKTIFDNKYTFVLYVFTATVSLSVYFVVRYMTDETISVERTFFALVFTTGICMMLCCWPDVSWDAFEHYNAVVQSTRLHGDVPTTDANNLFGLMNMIPEMNYEKVISYINRRNDGITGWIVNDFNWQRLPAAVPMVLANLFGISAYASFISGRMGQLIVYSLCAYFAIKRLHSGKMICAVVLAFPVNIFLATNYSDDYLVMGFIALGMAYFVGMLQEKETVVHYKDVLIMLAALVIGCMPKQIYIPVLLFPFFMSAKKLEGKKKQYYALCMLAVVITLASFAIASYGNMTGGGDPRAGLGEVNPMAQLNGIFDNPIWYVGILIDFLVQWWNPAINATGTSLAYLGNGSGYVVIVLLLVLVTITDKNEFDGNSYSSILRIYSFLHFVGVSALIVTALYLVFSPVGSTYMAGAQPRYMIPLIYPLCSVVAGKGVELDRIQKKWYNLIVLTIMFIINYVDMVQVMLPKTLY